MPIHENLATALAAFQAELPKMSKDERATAKGTTKDGRSYDRSYDYAGLDQFVEIVEPVLGRHGLSITSKTVLAPAFMLEVSLLHETGERETGYWPLPDPARSGPQDIGSAMTYGRRYIGWGLTGTFPGGQDDDGAQAQQASRERWEDAQPRQQARPVSAPPAPPAAPRVYTDDEVADLHVRLMTLDLEKSIKLYDWMGGKDLHNREVILDMHGGGPKASATRVLAGRLGDIALASTSLTEIAGIKALAGSRGLLKTQVSETETLDEALFGARELAQHAADAEASQDSPHPDPTGEQP